MSLSTTGKIIKTGFIIEASLTLVKNAQLAKVSSLRRREEIEKRSLCKSIKINREGKKVAFYEKVLSTGEIYSWEEIIESDPYNLYSLIK